MRRRPRRQDREVLRDVLTGRDARRVHLRPSPAVEPTGEGRHARDARPAGDPRHASGDRNWPRRVVARSGRSPVLRRSTAAWGRYTTPSGHRLPNRRLLDDGGVFVLRWNTKTPLVRQRRCATAAEVHAWLLDPPAPGPALRRPPPWTPTEISGGGVATNIPHNPRRPALGRHRRPNPSAGRQVRLGEAVPLRLVVAPALLGAAALPVAGDRGRLAWGRRARRAGGGGRRGPSLASPWTKAWTRPSGNRAPRRRPAARRPPAPGEPQVARDVSSTLSSGRGLDQHVDRHAGADPRQRRRDRGHDQGRRPAGASRRPGRARRRRPGR